MIEEIIIYVLNTKHVFNNIKKIYDCHVAGSVRNESTLSFLIRGGLEMTNENRYNF